MSDELALLRAVCEHPADDTPRLIFADWLDDNGQHERAEFIRLQCRVEGMLPRTPCICEPGRVCRPCETDGELRHALALENDLFIRSSLWLMPSWDHVYIGVRKWTSPRSYPGPALFASRGFVTEVTCTAADWLRHADALTWCRPKCGACGGHGHLCGADGVRAGKQCPTCEGRGTVPPMMDCECVRIWGLGLYPTELPTGCVQCGGTSRVPRPFPATAQPIERVTIPMATLPDATMSRFNALRKWAKPAQLGRDIRDSFVAEWPGITFEWLR